MCVVLNINTSFTVFNMIDVNNFLSFQVHGSAGGHKASDGVAGVVEGLLTFLESLVGLGPSELFSTLLPGISGMVNIHPVLVHFPIAFIFAFFIIDLIGSLLKKDSWRQLAAGLLIWVQLQRELQLWQV
jgi:hypothetical protein